MHYLIAMRLDIYFHKEDSGIKEDLSTVISMLTKVLSNQKKSELREVHMTAQLDRLAAEVAENGSVVGSAIELINGLAADIRELKDDPAALAALADSLDAKTNELAAAVATNTPAEEPAPEPEPEV